MSLEFMTPQMAYDQAGDRLVSESLQQKVSQYLGDVWPQGFEQTNRPKAVFAPYLAKGSVVEVEFLQIANDVRFDTVVATYEAAEFVTANPAIVDCYRAPLIESKGQCSRRWVVPDIDRSGAVGDANTIYPGVRITDYWQGIRDVVLEKNNLQQDDMVVDFGDWYRVQASRFGWQGQRSKAAYYYMALMGLYASGRAVLFDTPPTEFASRVMEPAAEMAVKKLAVQPLITRELRPAKRDWTDVSFLDEADCKTLQQTGIIGGTSS